MIQGRERLVKSKDRIWEKKEGGREKGKMRMQSSCISSSFNCNPNPTPKYHTSPSSPKPTPQPLTPHTHTPLFDILITIAHLVHCSYSVSKPATSWNWRLIITSFSHSQFRFSSIWHIIFQLSHNFFLQRHSSIITHHLETVSKLGGLNFEIINGKSAVCGADINRYFNEATVCLFRLLFLLFHDYRQY